MNSSVVGKKLSPYLLAIVMVALVTGIHWLIEFDHINRVPPFLLFYPAVILSIWLGGVGPGILATFLSMLMGITFFSPPFAHYTTANFFQLILFVFVSLTFCLLMGKLKLSYEEMEKRVQLRTQQLAQTNENLESEIQERKKVEKEILEISQKEQRRWGAQIHDNLCQNLTGIVLLIKGLIQKREKEGDPATQELKQITELLNRSIEQAKEMARGLYPVELQADSLMIALRDLAKRTESIFKVTCLFHCPKPIFIEDHNVATHLYRIAQEGIHNSIKHGKAQQIDISLIKKRHQILLVLQDNGEGFPEKSKNIPGIGIQIMKYRARMIDAQLEIKKQHPKGSMLVCSFS